MSDDQKSRVKKYVTTFDSDIKLNALLDLVIDTVSDRVLLYLNETEIAETLERVIAQVIVSNYQKMTSAKSGADRTIASVSDNGQTVSYHQAPAQYFGSKSDQELFTGFEALLSAYRRPHVITS